MYIQSDHTQSFLLFADKETAETNVWTWLQFWSNRNI